MISAYFPRTPAQADVLGERIEWNLYNLLETLIAAKYTKNGQPHLEEANLALGVLRFHRFWLVEIRNDLR